MYNFRFNQEAIRILKGYAQRILPCGKVIYVKTRALVKIYKPHTGMIDPDNLNWGSYIYMIKQKFIFSDGTVLAELTQTHVLLGLTVRTSFLATTTGFIPQTCWQGPDLRHYLKSNKSTFIWIY